MASIKLSYRGVAHDRSVHPQPSAKPVEHVYRGQHFEAPLRHEPAAVDHEAELHYRGITYHHHV